MAAEPTPAPMEDADADIWVLADPLAGHRAQALGVARALNRRYVVKEMEYGLLAGLTNPLLGASTTGLTVESRAALTPPWPRLIIAAGRRTAPVARAIKRRSGGASRLVQIMDPGPGGRSDFDLIAVPAHDRDAANGDGANRLIIPAAPHGITEQRLHEEADLWGPRFQAKGLGAPFVACLIGGSTRRRTMTAEMGRTLGAGVAALAKATGATVLATGSRRTPDTVLKTFAAGLEDAGVPFHLHPWMREGNPYLGFLALAQSIVVTGDSVSMCSEALAPGKPVFVYAPDGLISAKHRRMVDALQASRAAKRLEDVVSGDADVLSWTPANCDAAAMIAAATQKMMGER